MTNTRTTRRWLLAGAATVATVAASVLAGAGAAAAAPATGTIRPAGTAAVVPGSYIVVLKDSAALTSSGLDTTVKGLRARYGGTVKSTYRHALRGYEVSASEATAKRLAANPAVAYVQRNGVYHTTATQTPTPSWGLDRIDQRALPLNNSFTYPTTASGVKAYIVDTGIRKTHTNFGGRAITGFDAITAGGTADDCNGHGTHVSGTVGGSTYGVAKGVTLVAVRVLDCNGSGTTAQVVNGIDWVTGNHAAGQPAVANMSLGGGVDPTLDTSVANAIADGVTFGVAAGNDTGANACNTSPARVPTAITVGSTTSTDARSSFSNIGTCLDIFAPGSSITSSWNTNDTATNTISGTSMATPHVVGAAALVVAQNPTFTPQQVRDYLVNNATSGVVTSPGTGSPNKLLFVVNGTTPVNDFSVAVSPTSGSVVRGSSVSATVSTATTSGSAQAVSFSASGLPAGASATFTPTSVTSGGSSTLRISTTTSAVAGTYPLTITGAGASATHTASYTLTITAGGGGTCTSPGQKLGNAGFETGTTPWSSTAGVIGAFAGQPAHGGTRVAWLNGYGSARTETLSQAVTVPAGCSTYTLSFWLHIDSAETTTSTAYDTLKVQVISGTTTTTLATYSNLNKAAGYSSKSFNLAAFAGKSITIKFLGVEDSSLQTSFVVDDTALNVS